MTATQDRDGPGATGVEITGTEQHAAWAARTLPPVERLAAGLWSVPVPIPDNPLRYTLCYLVPGDGALVVVDPGWDTATGWDALTAGLAAAGAAPADVTGIVATHVHPDHHGLSGRLREASGAWIAMHPAERDTLPQRQAAVDPDGTASGPQRWLRSAGAPEAETAALMRAFDRGAVRPASEMAEPDVLLEDGDPVPLPGRRLSAVWTPGHTPGHLCLREPDARLLLTGDHVLPRITPNVGLHPDADNPVLADFVDSLAEVGRYDDHEALPAHEYRFRGIGARVRALHAHHVRRCQEIVDVVAELGEPTVWQLAERLTWSRSWAEIGSMRFAAIAETTAHVHHLVDGHRLEWSRPAGADGDAPARLRPAARPPGAE
jgi:glyoxylase-like metal-dependent hydrolase (beta-lactamase superfamily II)